MTYLAPLPEGSPKGNACELWIKLAVEERVVYVSSVHADWLVIVCHSDHSGTLMVFSCSFSLSQEILLFLSQNKKFS